MANSITIQPMSTTNGLGNFYVQSEGLMQGSVYDDPAVRFYLATGYLAATETLPMWGGIAITENITSITPPAIGNSLIRATAVANITGFSCYNQATSAIVTESSNAPSFSAAMTVPYFRLGSGARLAVAADPSLVSLETGAINQNVTWDFNNQRLMPYNAATATVNVTSVTASFSATTGLWTFAVVAAAPTVVGGVGDAINLSGVTGTNASLINGNQIVTSFTSNTSFSFQIAGTVSTFTAGAQTGTIVLNQSIGALSVKILEMQIGNSKIVQYNAVTGNVTWNTSGSAAIILL